LTNSVGCDSILTINLTINNNPTSSNVSISACGSYTWLADGNTYTASGTYTFAGTNASGCPQNDTLVLTISNSTTSNTTASACDTYTWSADGNTYTASGTYYFSMTNAYGCTQTDTLNLTINASPLITGPTMVSLASSINLMSSGTPASPNPWSSNNGNVSVSSSGVVQGLILGTSIITYQDLNTCSASKTIHIVDNNELDVTGNSVSISSGDVTPQIPDNTSFANVKLGTSRSRTFKIDYIGVTDLIVSSITSNNPLFTVSSLSPSNTISNGQSATFQVTLTPIANGTHTATITILNSDADQGVFTFDVQGTTIVMPPMVAPTD
jgi:hypothetical protein